MIYFTPPLAVARPYWTTTPTSHIGVIDSPSQGQDISDAHTFCVDNNCFSAVYPGDMPFLAYLSRRQPLASRCRFVVAPDVVADAKATIKRSTPFLPVIRALGFPVAFAAQDGLEKLTPPWDSFDTLFIGGSTEWKLSQHARDITAEALRRDKQVHMGRVNTEPRLRYAASIGCHSADGTTLVYESQNALPQLLRWLRDIDEFPPTPESLAAERSRTCQVCERQFTPSRADARTCGSRCRQALSRHNRAVTS